MKKITLYLIMVLALAEVVRAEETGLHSTTDAQHSKSASSATQPITITAEEWHELRAARAAAIKANPDLVAENTQMMAKIRDLEAKLDAAMVKTNPAIAPIMAKYEVNRSQPATPPATATSSPAAPTPSR